jgi:hypothetical protein
VLRKQFFLFEKSFCAHQQQLFKQQLSGLLVRAAIKHHITSKFQRNTNNGRLKIWWARSDLTAK